LKFVLFKSAANAELSPGLLTDRGVVDISGVVVKAYTPQLVMQGIIDNYEVLKPTLQKLADTGTAVPLVSGRLLAPLPRAG